MGDSVPHVDARGSSLRHTLIELGYTDADLARVENRARPHAEQGKEHFEQERFNEAASSFEAALKCAPWNDEFLGFSGRAYAQVYHRYADEKALSLARDRLRQHLDNEPGNESARIELDGLPPLESSTSSSLGGSRWIPLVLDRRWIFISLILLVIFGLRWVGSTMDSGASGPEVTEEWVALTEDEKNWLVHWHSLRALDDQVREIAVDLEVLSEEDGVLIDAAESTIVSSPASTDVHLRMRITNTSSSRLGALSGTVEWLNESGEILGGDPVQMRESFTTKLRAKDGSVYGQRFEVPPGTHSARMVRIDATRLPMDPPVYDAREACVIWRHSPPHGVSIRVLIRKKNTFNAAYPVYEMKFENNGVPLTSLKAHIVMFNADDRPITKSSLLNTRHLSGGWQPHWKTGEIRLSSGGITFKDGYGLADMDRICLVMSEVEVL